MTTLASRVSWVALSALLAAGGWSGCDSDRPSGAGATRTGTGGEGTGGEGTGGSNGSGGFASVPVGTGGGPFTVPEGGTGGLGAASPGTGGEASGAAEEAELAFDGSIVFVRVQR